LNSDHVIFYLSNRQFLLSFFSYFLYKTNIEVVIFLLICSTFASNLAEKTEVLTLTAQDDLTNRISALETKLNNLNGALGNAAAPVKAANIAQDGVDLRDYMYRDALIYQDIFNAYNSNIFVKKGAARGWDETSYVNSPWNLRHILNIGNGANSNGNGIKVNIPQGYNVIWLRVLGDRWHTFRVNAFSEDTQTDFNPFDYPERYATGFKNLNSISPDGAAPDSQWNVHMWMAIPVRNNAASYMIYSDVNADDWISGIAFSKNIWNHAYNSGVAYLWKINGGDAVGWGGENWNSDHLAYFTAGSNFEVWVPVIYSGKDKMVYIVEHNNNWTGTMHGNVFVNGQQVERFRTSWSNAFQRHYSSKLYDRYMGIRVPAAMIQQNDKFLRLRIDMTFSNNQNIHFREIGTHDY